MQRVNQKQLDLEILPEEARKELLSFYSALIQKYGIKRQKKLPNGFYNPIKIESYSKIAKREEIYET